MGMNYLNWDWKATFFQNLYRMGMDDNSRFSEEDETYKFLEKSGNIFLPH
jgi:hypothetical protein